MKESNLDWLLDGGTIGWYMVFVFNSCQTIFNSKTWKKKPINIRVQCFVWRFPIRKCWKLSHFGWEWYVTGEIIVIQWPFQWKRYMYIIYWLVNLFTAKLSDALVRPQQVLILDSGLICFGCNVGGRNKKNKKRDQPTLYIELGAM